MVDGVDTGRLAAAVLLKTLEEPPGPTVFVLLAEAVPADLATVASRCVRIDLPAVPAGRIAEWLRSQGVEEALAAELAEACDGSIERARMLLGDPGFLAHRSLWRSVPLRLDGTGSAAAGLASELLAAVDETMVALHQRHDEELAAGVSDAETSGSRRGPRKELEERHRREERRWRTDEIRAGLGVLAGAYRQRLVDAATRMDASGPARARSDELMHELAGAVDAVEAVVGELVRNPSHTLMLEALFVRLSAVGG